MTEDGNVELTYQYNNKELDTETYSVSRATGEAITNQFESADLSQYGYEITYLSRNNWTGTWPETMEIEAMQKRCLQMDCMIIRPMKVLMVRIQKCPDNGCGQWSDTCP